MDLSVGKYRGAYSAKHLQLVKQMKCFLAIFKQLTNDVSYQKAHSFANEMANKAHIRNK